MATETSINKFKELIDNCLQTTTTDLINSDNWGEFNFEDIEAKVNTLFEILNHFKILSIESLPETEITNFINELKIINKILRNIKNFSIKQHEPERYRNDIARQIILEIDKFYNAAHSWVAYFTYQKSDAKKYKKKLNDATSYIQTKKEEIDNVVLKAKEVSATVGVGHFSANFEEEAKIHKNNATTWLRRTVILASITLLFVISSYFILPIDDTAKMARIIQLLSTKIIVISILFTATLWAGKMYKATIHQMTINKHRSNSLRTFQVFINASNEISTKDAVLMETTKSIFSILPSGYIDNERNGGANNTSIIEVIKKSSDIIKTE